MTRYRLAGPLAALALLAGCATTPPPAKPVSAAAPPPAQPAADASHDWSDARLTPGAWRYVPGAARSYAAYGVAGAPPALVVACDRAAHVVAILRQGSAATLTITTSYGKADLPAGGLSHEGVPMAGVQIAARDNLLDRIGYSRGRFAVSGPGLTPVIVPSWAEPSRAIEDCRQVS